MTSHRNLVLTGFMGTGKTTVGRDLAERLGMEFVDTDMEIEARHGSIAHIFEHEGEDAFRGFERQIATELSERTGLVIATGGRLLLDPGNLRALSQHGRIFCLVATPDEILERVTKDTVRTDRPLLASPDTRTRIVELLAERASDYARFPQITTTSVTPTAAADEIADLWTGVRTLEVSNPGGGYAITVGAGVLPMVRELADIRGPAVLISDATVTTYGDTIGDVDLTIPLDMTNNATRPESAWLVCDQLLEHGVEGNPTIVTLGTREVLDIARLAVATCLPGAQIVHCPTTVTSMVDTDIRTKLVSAASVGMDLPATLKLPKAVVVDVALLQSLPRTDFRSGLREAITHDLMPNPPLLDLLRGTDRRSGGNLRRGLLAELRDLVTSAIRAHLSAGER